MSIEKQEDYLEINLSNSYYLFNEIKWPAGKSSGIAYADNVFSEEFCSNLIDFCKSNPLESSSGRTMSGVMPHVKVSCDWRLDQDYGDANPLRDEFDFRLRNELLRMVRVYQHSFYHLQFPPHSDDFVVGDTSFQIQQYKKNTGFYQQHIDGAPWIAGSRVLGGLLYLNTVSQGGGTQFPLQDLTIDAVAGRVALFSSHWLHPHSGLMPLSSDKWIVSVFFFGSSYGQ